MTHSNYSLESYCSTIKAPPDCARSWADHSVPYQGTEVVLRQNATRKKTSRVRKGQDKQLLKEKPTMRSGVKREPELHNSYVLDHAGSSRDVSTFEGQRQDQVKETQDDGINEAKDVSLLKPAAMTA
ncbi:hypothetical protein MMC25_003238 [Agyrium rufum]|nr:hypothetical protein [Agyrium rufum]